MKAKVNWIENLHLEGESETGHKVLMDSTPGNEKSAGPSPKELVLQGLAGCTMMDVVSILQKQRKDLKKFWIDVDAELSNEHPKVFTKIHLKYHFVSDKLDDNSANRAIELSREKYCAVHSMISKTANITYSFEIKRNLE